jgi:glucose/arabinose dehydrogenase
MCRNWTKLNVISLGIDDCMTACSNDTACSLILARALAVFCLALIFTASAVAQPVDLRLTAISQHDDIVDVRNAGDGSGRLFLVEQAGRIHINRGGVDSDTPFLNITNRVMSTGSEQGLLSLAFAPDYRTSGYFYVWYTRLGGDTRLSRFRVSENDPDDAEEGSEEVILDVAQPRANHNGGRLQFGPDGMLYLGLGDGGGSFDPDYNGQDGANLLGSLLRIDVDPAHGTYAIPPDNPFVGDGSVRDEIWATGLRNPWRISFDSATGDLYIADVGQSAWEEINVQGAAAGGGQNYGWVIMEGMHCTGVAECNPAAYDLPVYEYGHVDGSCSVTGGEVYRGAAYPGMIGKYFFADWCSGRIWSLEQDGEAWIGTELQDSGLNIQTFGLGEDGSLYAATASDGVYLLSDGEPVPEPAFQINAGLNDAWYNVATAGQGFFITVFETRGEMFLAWFTYDVERPPEDVTAVLGDPGHRWVVAQGPYEGDTAILDVYTPSGGAFDSIEPPVDQGDPVGTMTIQWHDCSSATLTYDIELAGQGSIPLQRIVTDNIPLCEMLQ